MAAELSRLMGLERATLGPSTLHILWDLVRILADGDAAIYVDSGVYPIGRWGVERAAARGVPVRRFRHLDADSLEEGMEMSPHGARRAVVVADGFCPTCGRVTPIEAYLEKVRDRGGHLVLDDTQALGVLGARPGTALPYGRGGGGSLRWSKVSGPEIVVVCSLAKAFGVPIAVLGGSEPLVGRYEEQSETRVHCSPPSVPLIRAAAHALRVNRERGDALRSRLYRLVSHFRRRLDEAGLAATAGAFPVQTLSPIAEIPAATLHSRLLEQGVQALFHRPRQGRDGRVSFIITVLHRPADIDRAVEAVVLATKSRSKRSRILQ